MDPDPAHKSTTHNDKSNSPVVEKKDQQQQKTDSKAQSKIFTFLVDAPPLNLSQKISQKQLGCNCRKSRCLKMYCVCFSKGKMCDKTCFCDDCKNKSDNMARSEAINEIITKDPYAFSKGQERDEINGFIDQICNCKRSNCMKKYCECYRRGKTCRKQCKCVGCMNVESEKSLQGLVGKKRVKRE